MSAAEIETIRTLYAAVERNDWETAAQHADPEFAFTPPDVNPLRGTYRGVEAVRQFFEELWAAFDEVELTPTEFIEADDGRILAFLDFELRPTGTDASIAQHIAHLWTMRSGKAFDCRVYVERAEALAAAGLPA